VFANGLSAGVVPDASGQSIVYALGGRDDDGGCGANILTYKIGTNTWASKGFEPRVYVYNSNGVGKIGNTLYISGGESYCGGSHLIDGGFSAYDPATNTRTEKATPPKLTAAGVTGVIDGKLYVLPGICSTDFYPENPYYCVSEQIRTLYRYTPAIDHWAWKRPAPHYHANGAGGVINGKFYVAGGANNFGSQLEASLDRYDPATDTWTTLAPLPAAGGAIGAVLQGKLFVVVQTTTGRRAYTYDPATNKWTPKAAPRLYHDDIVPITWAGKPFLLAVGGVHFSPYSPNATEVYAP
jgi:N-acetylneuraminic acid mutarotase